MTCRCPPLSPFKWRECAEPSIFMRERHGEWNGNGRAAAPRATATKPRQDNSGMAEVVQPSPRTNWATVK